MGLSGRQPGGAWVLDDALKVVKDGNPALVDVACEMRP
jgi:hypothetical protein